MGGFVCKGYVTFSNFHSPMPKHIMSYLVVRQESIMLSIVSRRKTNSCKLLQYTYSSRIRNEEKGNERILTSDATKTHQMPHNSRNGRQVSKLQDPEQTQMNKATKFILIIIIINKEMKIY